MSIAEGRCAIADRFAELAVGNNNWSSTDTWKATTDGATGASVPTSSDDVYINADSVQGAGATLTVDATAYCLDMDWTGATNTPRLTTSAASNIYGSLTLINDMTLGGAHSWTFKAADARTLTSNGKTIPYEGRFAMTGAGSITLQDAAIFRYTSSVASGVLDTNNQAITFNSTFTLLGSGTLTLGSSTFTCAGWIYTAGTLTANTATINVTGTGAVALGDADYNGADFNRNGTATKTDTLTLTSGATLTCTTFAMIGNSVTNRLLVQSSTLGTAATVTATNWTGADNFDLMDITATNAVDLSGVSSGDCGGNTDITFTTAAAQTWDGTTGNWSTAARWTTRVPLPQDDVTASGSNTLTGDMPRAGKTVTFGSTLTFTPSVAVNFYGSVTYASGMTLTASNYIYYRGRGAYTVTTNGISLLRMYFYAPTGTYTIADNITLTHATALKLYDGTINLGSSTITMNATGAGTRWEILGGSVTAGSSTIIFTNSTTGAIVFAAGSQTYNHVRVEGAGAYTLTMTGNNTFNTLTIDRSQAAKTLAGAVSCTVTTLSIPVVGTNVVTITDVDFVMVSGRIATNYLVLAGSVASGGASFYAGSMSTDSGGNSGWMFREPIGAWK